MQDTNNMLLDQDPLLRQSVEAIGMPDSMKFSIPDGILRKFAVVTAATGAILGLGLASDIESDNVDEVFAGQSTPCVAPAVTTSWIDINQNGIPDNGDDFTCFTPAPPTAPPAPQPTSPPATSQPSSGGGGNSGSSGSGSGGGTSSGSGGNTAPQPTSPPKPTFGDILSFIGCEDDKGDPEFALQLNELKAEDGSGRMVQVIDSCELDFLEESGILDEFGRPGTNWEDIIANPDLDITPNDAQTNALNIYLKNLWDSLNPPATTTTSTIAATTTPATSSSTSTSVPEITAPITEDTVSASDTENEPSSTVKTTENLSTDSNVANVDTGSDSEWLEPVLITSGVVGLGFIGFLAYRRKRKNEEEK